MLLYQLQCWRLGYEMLKFYIQSKTNVLIMNALAVSG